MTTRTHSRWIASAALLAGLTVSLIAAAKLSKTGSSEVVAHAKGPGGMGIDVKTSELSVADDGTNVTITVPLAKLETGMSLRNKHTKEALATDKVPNASLSVARGAIKFPADGADSSGDVDGTLTIHGAAKPVRVHYSAQNAGGTYSVKGTIKNLDFTNHGMPQPGYLGIKVEKTVDIDVKFQVKD
jgi:polyisoprenoid-binding protein YceI